MQSFGWTALHWAADRGLLEVTNMLLDYEADVNVRDLNEATPLIAAARTNALATARALLARGAGVNITDVSAHSQNPLSAPLLLLLTHPARHLILQRLLS